MKRARFLGVCNCPWRVPGPDSAVCLRDERPCKVEEAPSGFLFCRWWREDGRPVSGLSQLGLFRS
jgi:hypothetical protein